MKKTSERFNKTQTLRNLNLNESVFCKAESRNEVRSIQITANGTNKNSEYRHLRFRLTKSTHDGHNGYFIQRVEDNMPSGKVRSGCRDTRVEEAKKNLVGII